MLESRIFRSLSFGWILLIAVGFGALNSLVNLVALQHFLLSPLWLLLGSYWSWLAFFFALGFFHPERFERAVLWGCVLGCFTRFGTDIALDVFTIQPASAAESRSTLPLSAFVAKVFFFLIMALILAAIMAGIGAGARSEKKSGLVCQLILIYLLVAFCFISPGLAYHHNVNYVRLIFWLMAAAAVEASGWLIEVWKKHRAETVPVINTKNAMTQSYLPDYTTRYK